MGIMAFTRAVQNNSVNGFGYGSLPATQPQPQFGEITQVENAAVSNYNGLVASYKHRFNSLGGGLIQLNYTYSHALDEISNGGFATFALTGNYLSPQDPYNLRDNYGPADYDVRHSFNANYVWQVPIRRALGHGHGMRAAGRWVGRFLEQFLPVPVCPTQ